MNLSKLHKGGVARIVAIDGRYEDLNLKLREMGLTEGDEVEMLAHGPLGGQPLAVRINRTMIALRKAEAEAVRILPAP